KLKRVYKALGSHPAMLSVINDEHLADPDGRQLGATYLGNVRKLGFPDTYHVAGCCTALRRDLLRLLLPFPSGVNYDIWIARMTDFLGVRIVLDAPLQPYPRHPPNPTQTILAEQSASMVGLVRRYGLTDPRKAWLERIGELDTYRERLREAEDLVAQVAGADRAAVALDRIEAERAQWSRRLQLLSKPRFRRALSILRLWRQGFYSHFAGGK